MKYWITKVRAYKNLAWIKCLWIQEVTWIQLGILRRILITKWNFAIFALFSALFSALVFSALPPNGWGGLEFIGKSRSFWSDELARNLVVSLLWVSSYFVGEESAFESCRPLSERNLPAFESLLSLVVLCRRGICFWVSFESFVENFECWSLSAGPLKSFCWNGEFCWWGCLFFFSFYFTYQMDPDRLLGQVLD